MLICSVEGAHNGIPALAATDLDLELIHCAIEEFDHLRVISVHHLGDSE